MLSSHRIQSSRYRNVMAIGNICAHHRQTRANVQSSFGVKCCIIISNASNTTDLLLRTAQPSLGSVIRQLPIAEQCMYDLICEFESKYSCLMSVSCVARKGSLSKRRAICWVQLRKPSFGTGATHDLVQTQDWGAISLLRQSCVQAVLGETGETGEPGGSTKRSLRFRSCSSQK
jgi:hypothetical protein